MPHARPRDPRSGGSMSKERTTKESVIVSLVLYWIYFCPEIIFFVYCSGRSGICYRDAFPCNTECFGIYNMLFTEVCLSNNLLSVPAFIKGFSCGRYLDCALEYHPFQVIIHFVP